LLKCFTSNCKVKCDSVENGKVIDFLTFPPYWFSSIQKCSSCNQCNNIVWTTQSTNDQMSEFHCHCECSRCPEIQHKPSVCSHNCLCS